MASGIRDKVVILGAGCSRFGERWDCGAEDLLIESFTEALSDAGIEKRDIDAAWFAHHDDMTGMGKGGAPLSVALRLPNIAVTRVENFCAGGSEALRGAAYAVASGAADIALAIGVEKLKDVGFGGLPPRYPGSLTPLWAPSGSNAGNFAQLASAYCAKHRIAPTELKRAMAHVSVKSHDNGLKNPKAHLRRKITLDQAMSAGMIAEPLGLFDCCGVSDGSAAAIVTTPQIAKSLGKTDMVSIKAMQVSVSNGFEAQGNGWDGSYFHTARVAAKKAYNEAGILDPAKQIDFMEVHDCFSITELVTMEDLFISQEGRAYRDVLDGRFDAGGENPCQIDGGLKCFGHPIGASGLRMLYEMYLQLLGRAEERQLRTPATGLTHNLGGEPAMNVCSINILGLLNG
jgi:acetyl-CoA C-acetyltransferase